MNSIITQVELSRLAGTTRQAVSKAIGAGHIKVNRKRRVVFDHDLTQLWYQKQVAKNTEAPAQGMAQPKTSESEPAVSLISLQREKLEQEIGKITADKRLKQLQLAQKRDVLIEKDAVAGVLFQYIDALNIAMLDMPEMVVDVVIDKISAGANRGEIIKIMRDSIRKSIVSTKKQIKGRLK